MPFRRDGPIFPSPLTSLLSWVMAFWMFYAFLRGFGISTSFLNVVFGSTVAIIANAFPISGLGNWGILEAGWAAGFLLVGLSKVEAIATGFGVHIIIFITSAIMSLLAGPYPAEQRNSKALPQLAEGKSHVERRAPIPPMTPKGLNYNLLGHVSL